VVLAQPELINNMSEVKKKVQFVDTDIRHAQLRIQLEREDLTQAEFFRACLTGMIENDTTFMSYIRKYKGKKNIGQKRSAKVLEKEDQASDDLMKKFGIKDDELENIFDLIAEEHPDL
jgi:succinate dehydrogenase flavin-adding protein (antitoxin of CptAB toxin-antitoxin module)